MPATICASDHLRDVLVGNVGEAALAQLGERRVGAVAEQQELEVLLPHHLAEPQGALVGVEYVEERRVAIVVEHHLVGLVLRQRRHPQLGDLGDQRLHLLAPLGVELLPVGEVVAGAALEELGALRDLGRVGDGVAGDVDVAVDDAVVDAHRRRHGEDAVLPCPNGLVGAVDAGHVEGRHGQREVHRVPEPETVLVLLASRGREECVVGIDLLPALAAGRGVDRVRARECARGRRCCHCLPSSPGWLHQTRKRPAADIQMIA